jgi:hypothetical protein
MALVALLGVIFPVAAQSASGEGVVAGWNRSILRHDSGKAWGCAIEKGATGRTSIGVIMTTRPSFLVMMVGEHWKLREDAEYPLSYSIDHQRRVSTTGTAITEQLVVFMPEDLESFIYSFYHGQTLRIHTAKETFAVSLNGSAKSTEWITSCFGRISGADQQNNPFTR